LVRCAPCDNECADDASFCSKCGSVIGTHESGWTSAEFEARAKDFAKDMERYGKEAAKKAETFTRGLIRDVEKLVQGRSVCVRCGTSWPGVHDYCAKCGAEIK